jgi:hypothetical protein
VVLDVILSLKTVLVWPVQLQEMRSGIKRSHLKNIDLLNLMAAGRSIPLQRVLRFIVGAGWLNIFGIGDP